MALSLNLGVLSFSDVLYSHPSKTFVLLPLSASASCLLFCLSALLA